MNVRRDERALGTDELEAWVKASCDAQDVPVKVTDPTTIRRVATLLGATRVGELGSGS